MTQTGPQHARPPSRGPAATFTLVVESQAGASRHPIERPRLVLGRAADCDIVVPDPTVSRRHLVVELVDGIVRFRDLGGTNVPLLDGRPATDGMLAPGSVLLIGMCRVWLEAATATAASRRPLEPRDRTVVVMRSEAVSRDGRGASIDAVLAALHRPPLRGPDFVAEASRHLLESALGLTGRTRGAVVRAEADAPLRVVASVPVDPAAFGLPDELQKPGLEPFCLSPWPAGNAADERLVVPLAPHADAVLVLGVPRAGSPPSDLALGIAVAFAPIGGAALVDAEQRAALALDAERLRFARSYPARAVRASTRLHGVRRSISEAAAAGSPVVLLAEEGCETDEIAQFYHGHSGRPTGPLVRCYARLLPPQRIAEQLGTPGAIQEGAGTCDVRARGGTLFVDSPEALPSHLQARLAQVLDDNLTATDPPRFQAVISLVAHEDGGLPELAPELGTSLQRFVTVVLPPLRSFPQDVLALCDVILDDLGPTPAGEPRRLTDAAERLLRAHHWPGNVRQLCRVVETAASLAGDAPIDARHLPSEIREPSTGNIRVPTLREVEREHILRVLNLLGDNKTRAAKKLDISASTLHEKLRKYRFGE